MQSDNQPQAAAVDVFAEVKCALVVCAHADDMETMMGGTIWLLTQRGVEVFELVCTRGDLGTQDANMQPELLTEIRKEEARKGAHLLGVREVVTLDYHDGELEPTLDLRAQIASCYRRWQPDTIFAFDPNWAGRPTRTRAAGRAAIDAIMPSKMPLYKPEQLVENKIANPKNTFLFGPAEPSIFVDVTGIYGNKEDASLAHKSQFPGGLKSLDWMRALDSDAAKRIGSEGHLVEQFSQMRIW